VGQALGWVEFSGAAALRFFVKGADFILLFFRADVYSDKCSEIVGLGRAARGEFQTGCRESGLVVILRAKSALRMTFFRFFPQPAKVSSAALFKTIDREIRFVVPTATA
jgi:hypothetical protein